MYLCGYFGFLGGSHLWLKYTHARHDTTQTKHDNSTLIHIHIHTINSHTFECVSLWNVKFCRRNVGTFKFNVFWHIPIWLITCYNNQLVFSFLLSFSTSAHSFNYDLHWKVRLMWKNIFKQHFTLDCIVQVQKRKKSCTHAVSIQACMLIFHR